MYVLVHVHKDSRRDSPLEINRASGHAFVQPGGEHPLRQRTVSVSIPENEHDQIPKITIADNGCLLSH